MHKVTSVIYWVFATNTFQQAHIHVLLKLREKDDVKNWKGGTGSRYQCYKFSASNQKIYKLKLWNTYVISGSDEIHAYSRYSVIRPFFFCCTYIISRYQNGYSNLQHQNAFLWLEACILICFFDRFIFSDPAEKLL